MVPRVAVLHGREVVGKGVTRGDGALGDAVDAVHLVGIELSDSMPVDSRAIVRYSVGDVDDYLVAPASLYDGPGIGAVKVLALSLRDTIGFQLFKQVSYSAMWVEANTGP